MQALAGAVHRVCRPLGSHFCQNATINAPTRNDKRANTERYKWQYFGARAMRTSTGFPTRSAPRVIHVWCALPPALGKQLLGSVCWRLAHRSFNCKFYTSAQWYVDVCAIHMFITFSACTGCVLGALGTLRPLVACLSKHILRSGGGGMVGDVRKADIEGR